MKATIAAASLFAALSSFATAETETAFDASAAVSGRAFFLRGNLYLCRIAEP